MQRIPAHRTSRLCKGKDDVGPRGSRRGGWAIAAVLRWHPALLLVAVIDDEPLGCRRGVTHPAGANDREERIRKKHAKDKQHSNDRPETSGKKLALGKETLRALGGTELGQIAGGKFLESLGCEPSIIDD